jgi:valyl-tRNA synthetase
MAEQPTSPERYDPKVAEPKWQTYWEKEGIFAFDQHSDKEVYSVDTPPPTVSGKMHIGHAFSFSQQDFIVRYKRMRGYNIFCPFGTDDNGLATERLIEKTKNIKARNMPRDEFVKLCLKTLETELRPRYIEDWKRIGMSCDWNICYSTIDKNCQKISQREFINLYNMSRAYRKDAPSMWCPECNTGISQVECVDKELSSFFNDIIFKVEISGKEEELVIATTRPELLPACVAVFYHPTDDRYRHLKGKKAKVPLFDFEVPILEDERADPAKGTGIVMCCTFGDQTDMEWQKAHNLPIKEAITTDGKMTPLAGKYQGHDLKTARKMMIEDMKDSRLLISQTPIKHAVNVHERCGTEIEYIKAKQWFIRYLDLKDNMITWGNTLNWFPSHMKNRYDNWVNGLQWDWLISRQRFFGVPFPVWYCKKCDETILANENQLPVDPLKDTAPVAKCPKCGNTEFFAEKDIMDTWATSSLTPRLAVELMPKEVQSKIFPMSLRPQAHDIITFWLFNTTFRSNIHYNCNPWKDCMISGWALDPKGKKMSKSLGNIVEPQAMIEKYCADALRFWAASSSLGDDLPFMEKDLLTGNKMITKLWNASKFNLMHLQDFNPKEIFKAEDLEIMDLWILSRINQLIKSVTAAFDVYEYNKDKLEVEKFFWQDFCDNYLEICKDRLYNPTVRGTKQRASAQFALYNTLLAVLKLTAPIMPYITEEIYHLYFAAKEGKKSIHISSWPEYDEKFVDDEALAAGNLFVSVLQDVRRAKSEAKKSLKEPVSELLIEGKVPAETFVKMEDDLKAITKAVKVFYKKMPASSEKDYVCEIKF